MVSARGRWLEEAFPASLAAVVSEAGRGIPASVSVLLFTLAGGGYALRAGGALRVA